MPAPYEIVAGPASIWAAPLATAMPLVTDSDPVVAVPAWVYLGYTEGGVMAKDGQAVSLLRVDQKTGPVKAVRSEDTLEVSTQLAQLTLENLDKILNRLGLLYALVVNPSGANNAISFTTVVRGDTAVRVKTLGGLSQSLSVSVSSKDITIQLATNGSSVVTSTAAQVVTAVNANGPASALVTAALDTSSTGDATNDGSGVFNSVFGFKSVTSTTDGNARRDVSNLRGLDVAQIALLVRGPSPYVSGYLQYEVPRCVQVEEPELSLVRDDKATAALRVSVISDDSGTPTAPFGYMRAASA